MESVIKQYNWGSQVCACPEKDCVIVEQVGNVFTWKQELCSAEHRHICKGSQHGKSDNACTDRYTCTCTKNMMLFMPRSYEFSYVYMFIW